MDVNNVKVEFREDVLPETRAINIRVCIPVYDIVKGDRKEVIAAILETVEYHLDNQLQEFDLIAKYNKKDVEVTRAMYEQLKE